MSALVRFNPQAQTFVSQKQDGTWAPKPVTRQGIVSNRPPQKAGPQILTQHPVTPSPGVKILP
jgi:hypothetical protein